MADTREDQEKLYGTARYWQREIDQASEFEKDWRDRGIRVVERYRDERDTGVVGPLTHRFNILWANTETLKGALFARMAQPDVRRRFNDGDTSARQVAIALERALLYGLDVYDSELPIRAAPGKPQPKAGRCNVASAAAPIYTRRACRAWVRSCGRSAAELDAGA